MSIEKLDERLRKVEVDLGVVKDKLTDLAGIEDKVEDIRIALARSKGFENGVREAAQRTARISGAKWGAGVGAIIVGLAKAAMALGWM
jgi:hypothetical protein